MSDIRTGAVREARLINARAKRVEQHEEERELDALDDAIISTNHEELLRLRKRSES
jgi:hypothetical protein